MSAEPITAQATLDEAREITARLQGSVAAMLDLVATAWERRVWIALDYPNWKAYLTAEVPDIADLKLPVARRREVVREWASKGMSQPAMAAALNTSPATINADVKATVPADAAAQVISLDGRRRTARVPAPRPVTPATNGRPKLSQVDRVIQIVAGAGAMGATVRDVCKLTGWHHGTASSALSKAHNKRRAIRPLPTVADLRDGCAPYVLTD